MSVARTLVRRTRTTANACILIPCRRVFAFCSLSSNDFGRMQCAFRRIVGYFRKLGYVDRYVRPHDRIIALQNALRTISQTNSQINRSTHRQTHRALRSGRTRKKFLTRCCISDTLMRVWEHLFTKETSTEENGRS